LLSLWGQDDDGSPGLSYFVDQVPEDEALTGPGTSTEQGDGVR
jgi:hypothetical protein